MQQQACNRSNLSSLRIAQKAANVRRIPCRSELPCFGIEISLHPLEALPVLGQPDRVGDAGKTDGLAMGGPVTLRHLFDDDLHAPSLAGIVGVAGDGHDCGSYCDMDLGLMRLIHVAFGDGHANQELARWRDVSCIGTATDPPVRLRDLGE